jgi:predicted ATPase
VIARNPGEPTSYKEMGLNKLYLGETEEAAEWFRRADAIAPADPDRWTWLQALGRALIQLGRDAEAVDALSKSMDNNPGHLRGKAWLAAAEALSGDEANARRHLAEYMMAEPQMTVERFAAERSSVPLDVVSPVYRREIERISEGLRRAGMPAGNSGRSWERIESNTIGSAAAEGSRSGSTAEVLPPVSDLIGRDAVLREIADLARNHRLVTLTGPGGIGKTTLALEVVRSFTESFDGGTWLVELASLSGPDLVPSAVATVLGLRIAGHTISAEAVALGVGGRNLLLVLDNCEHVIDAAAKTAEAIVRLCPRVRILATSREVLQIEGEYVYRVPPLDVPAAEEQEVNRIRAQSSVELFIRRTSAMDQTLALRSDDLPAIGAICRHLDGIPLAIELAAARAAVLGVQAVLSGLRDRFALLTGGRRTALPRHRTLRAMFDWSYKPLPEEERLLLRRLAVFPAGFTIDAAAAVTDEGVGTPAIVDGISNLVVKSLITVNRSGGANRWQLLETTRAYAFEKLAESGELEHAMRCSAEYFRVLFAPSPSGSRSRLSDDELTRRAREIDNVRAALDWCFSASGDSALGVHLTAAYATVWLRLSLMQECRERCERALLDIKSDKNSDMWQRMRLQTAFGVALNTIAGPSAQVRTILEEALELAGALNDFDAQVWVLGALSAVYVYQGQYGKARSSVERLREAAYRIGEPAILGIAERRMGNTLLSLGRLREAQEFP